ncbi:MBL fold metallo-hydrolase [Pseudogracilibacillus auburnensis]|uniref:Beta-lactamase superfamily II metal-dependent hydrolase n=1 Tax=Pseudogracilibacillus auburnensis TaxID=1494959 RepID=A0A2V3WBH3_9BACI|nr:MBL fold metallo-hydrolase [Pseudogracilibacillus auburnensis]MBO1005444.1 MBL fold metallo-hydrolase [Pseudogracilibacillus auburnensis]PXW90371.1 beta-lactamase superfamily II metal-dependent hydrolase [Pseudogracilibacillus auburnensis]
MHKQIQIMFLFLILLLGCQNTTAGSPTKQIGNSTDEATKTVQNQLTVHYIDVGQGDATLFQYVDENTEYTILYDTGDWQGNEVVPYLQKENVHFIDVIIISHPHADHIGQLENVMKNFDVGEVWMSGNSTNTKLFQSAMEAVLESDANYEEPTAGDIFDIGSLELVVLHPESLTGGLNEDSLSIRFTYGEVSFLFTGDAYKKQERQIIQRTDDIQADFLQLGHHGSKTSSDPEFIEAVQPKYAIYSAGAGNSYGHPNEEVVDLFAEKEIPLYGTDMHGTIMVKTDGVKSTIETEIDAKEDKKPNDDCIDINRATKQELVKIVHIGETRAEEIIQLRPFHSIDDLMRINGISSARLKDIKAEEKACIGGN